MDSFFSADFFIQNRRRLRAQITDGSPIIITSNGLLQRGGDSSYAFCQDANFWYLTGIDEPDLILVIEQSKEYLMVPTREATRKAFDGALDTPAFVSRSGIDNIVETTEGWRLIEAALQRTKTVSTIVPATDYIESYGLYVNPARARLISRIKEKVSDIEIIDIVLKLVHMRMIKQKPELAAIQKAISITLSTIKKATAAGRISKYRHEYELEAEISKGFRSRGASGHSFEPIVAGGQRACTLHNIVNDSPLGDDELIIIDVGAEVEHYAADITRTVSNGRPTERQRQIHAAVADVQQYAFGLLKPGVFISEYEKKVEVYMGAKLVELGLIEKPEHDAIRRYYPHATSHFLGLNVHDVGDYEMPLAAGMVITVEPGIYVPQESIGVRIEDDVLIIRSGVKILSKAFAILLVCTAPFIAS